MRPLRLAAALAALALGTAASGAQTPAPPAQPALPPMTPAAFIKLWTRAPGAVGDSIIDQPSITVYLPPKAKATGAMAVVFPGGGYSHLATEKEGNMTARWLNDLGVAAGVVQYRLGMRYHHPSMLQDAQRAVRTARLHAAEWGVDTARIGVVGFSAGGHIASSVGTHFDAGTPSSVDPVERMSARPSFMVLVYPVITMDSTFTHRGSLQNLLGDHPDPALVRLMSSEKQVTATTPPTFLVGTTDDRTVPIENSLAMYKALRDAKVPVEMHIFETGAHGFGMGTGNPVLSTWAEICARWMRARGILGAAR